MTLNQSSKLRYVYLLLLVGVLCFLPPQVAAWYDNYPYRRSINCSDMNPNNPLVVNGSLCFMLNNTQQCAWTNCQPNLSVYYADYLNWTIANSSAKVPYEVELGNISSNNPTDVWLLYVDVYHGANLNDSTGRNNLKAYNTIYYNQDSRCIVGPCFHFNDASSTLGNSTTVTGFPSTSQLNITFLAFAYKGVAALNGNMMGVGQDVLAHGYQIYDSGSSMTASVYGGDSQGIAGGDKQNIWVMRWVQGVQFFSKNLTTNTTNTYNAVSAAPPFAISIGAAWNSNGANGWGTNNPNASLDEVRISTRVINESELSGYKYNLYSVAGYGMLGPEETKPIINPPNNFTVTAPQNTSYIQNTSVIISWTNATDPQNYSVSYNLTLWQGATQTAVINSAVSNLIYPYSLTAANGGGYRIGAIACNSESYCTNITFSPYFTIRAPAAPTGLTFTSPLNVSYLQNRSINITWTAASDPENTTVYYNVSLWQAAFISTLNTNTTSLLVAYGMTDDLGGGYYAKIRACNSWGACAFFNSPSFSIRETAPPLPGSWVYPNTAITKAQNTTITLSWTDLNSQDGIATSYFNLSMFYSNGTLYKVLNSSFNALTYNITLNDSAGTYEFGINGCDVLGRCTAFYFSGNVSVSYPVPAPAPPVNFGIGYNWTLSSVQNVMILGIMMFFWLGCWVVGFVFRNFAFCSMAWLLGALIGFMLLPLGWWASIVFLLLNTGIFFTVGKSKGR